MLSHRVPHDPEPNAWARRLAALRAAGAPLLDLTDADPTRNGLGGAGPEELAALAHPSALVHRPDACGDPAARAAVASYLSGPGAAVEAADVVLTASTSEGYAHLFRLLCDPGERVLVPAPSYPLFEPLAAAEGVTLTAYRLAWDGRWHVDLGSLEHATAAEGARAVIVVQPNHPTGSCLSAAEVAALESLCARRGLALIADEVFRDFAWDPARRLPTLLGPRAVPTFVLGGLSKACGMPQLKAGWIAIAGPAGRRAEALRGLEWLADLFLSVSGPVQAALPRLLETRHAYRLRVAERLARNLATLRATLERCPALTWLEGDGGWVAVVRLPGPRDDESWALALLEAGVVVHPGHFYDLEGGAFAVVSLIGEPAAFAAGLERLAVLTR